MCVHVCVCVCMYVCVCVMVVRMGAGMRQVVEFGDRSTGRGQIYEFAEPHCNQWGICSVRVLVSKARFFKITTNIKIREVVHGQD